MKLFSKIKDAFSVRLIRFVSRPPIYKFYIAMEILGFVGMAMLFGLLAANNAKWYVWVYNITAFLLIEFGAFAWRDRKNEFPDKDC